MKKAFVLSWKLFLIILFIFTVSCGKKGNSDSEEVTINPKIKGGVPEKILFSIKTDQSTALKDIVKGDFDVFINKIPASILNGLNENDKAELDIYSAPSESWNFVLNPFPNKAPYQINVNGTTEFNPFAIKEVRYALNFLMDRKYITDKILNGAGGPNFTPITPGNQNSWIFELQAGKLGFTPEGNKEKAIKEINKALEKAADFPENKNKLIKKNGFWNFEGKPVVIKFIMEADDPEGTLKLGNYFAALIEQTGIKVEKLLLSKSKAVQSVYNEDPAQLSWHIYAETWKADSTYVWQDVPVIQAMTSLWGNQPGWGNSSWWNYKNEEADKLANKWLSGKIESVDELWKDMLRINEIGLDEAVRLFVTYQINYFVANKARFNERMFYGLGTGIGRHALENANTKDGVLKVLQYSASGRLSTSPWNPIGTKGFDDIYTSNITQMVFDKEIVNGPFGQLNEKRVSIVSSKVDPIFEKNASNENPGISGNIFVDEKALVINSATKKYKKVGKGIKAAIETTYRINFGVWHSGRDIKKSDYLYAENFINEWSYENIPGDKKFNWVYASYWIPQLKANVGSKWNTDGTVTVWSNNFSPKGGLNNVGGVPSLSVSGNRKHRYAVPWEVMEAIQAMILDTSKSGIKYGFDEKEGIQPIDLKSAAFVADLKSKLLELATKKYVPEILTGEVTPDEAAENYALAVKFIDTYGHALIGQGPYILTKFDLKTGYAELTAFRDKNYTEVRGKWAKLYRSSRLIIDEIIIPKTSRSGEEIEITVDTSEVIYPSEETKKSLNGSTSVLFINKNGEVRMDAVNNGDGTFTLKLDSETSKSFKGAYTLVIFATLDGRFTDTKIKEIVIN